MLPFFFILFIAPFVSFWIALIWLCRDLDDALSDDAMESFANPLVLPQPEIGNLDDIEHAMRGIASTPQGRDALAKFVISEDYIRKLIPLVEVAEDLESLKDLHWLCNIMKMLILLNDSQIIDHIVNEEVVFGVIGALECQYTGAPPPFPPLCADSTRHILTFWHCRRSRLPPPQGKSPTIPQGQLEIQGSSLHCRCKYHQKDTCYMAPYLSEGRGPRKNPRRSNVWRSQLSHILQPSRHNITFTEQSRVPRTIIWHNR